MNLTEIRLENFKAHRKLELPLRKFTILIGPNSTGKSSILQSLLILKRSLGKLQQNQNLITNTDSIDLGEFKDIVTFGETDKHISIHLVGSKKLEHGIENTRETNATFGYKVDYDKSGIKEVYLAGHIGHLEYTYDFNRNSDAKASCWYDRDKSLEIEKASLEGFHPKMHAKGSDKDLVFRFNQIFGSSEFTKQLLNDFHYVPFFRVATKYGEILTRFSDDFLLNRPSDILRFLLSNLSKDPQLLDTVSNLMEQLIGKTIQSRTLDLPASGVDQGTTIDFIKKGFRNAITNEGTGPNQAILLLSVLAGTKAGSVIAIDEPEIHLHPKGQTRLAKMMMELGKSQDKQIIFATHSEHMIYPFLASIASKQENSLNLSDLAIYYVGIDDKTNLSKVEPLEINEHGQIRGGLRDFWENDLKVFSEFLGEPHE